MCVVGRTWKLGDKTMHPHPGKPEVLSANLHRPVGLYDLRTKHAMTDKSNGNQVTMAFLSLGRIVRTENSYQKL